MQTTPNKGCCAALTGWFRKNWVTLVIAAIAVASSLSATLVSYKFSNDSINDLGLQLRSQVNANIEKQIQSYLYSKVSALPVLADAFSRGLLNVTSSSPSERPRTLAEAYRFMWTVMESGGIYTLAFQDRWSADFGFSRVELGPTFGENRIIAAFHSTLYYTPWNVGPYLPNRKDGFYRLNLWAPVFEGNVPFEGPPFRQFNITTFTYSSVETWSEPAGQYADRATTPTYIDLTYRLPVKHWESGEVFGSLDAHITLEQFNQLLVDQMQQLGTSNQSVGLIFYANGKLMADSLPNSVIVDQYTQLSTLTEFRTNGTSLTNFWEHPDPRLNAAGRQVLELARSLTPNKNGPVDFTRLPRSATFSFDYGGEVQLALLSRVSFPPDLECAVLSVVPESDFNGAILAGRRLLVPIVITASCISVLRHLPWKRMTQNKRCCGGQVQQQPQKPRGPKEDPAVTAWNAEQQHQQQQNRKSNARQAFTDLEDNAPT